MDSGNASVCRNDRPWPVPPRKDSVNVRQQLEGCGIKVWPLWHVSRTQSQSRKMNWLATRRCIFYDRLPAAWVHGLSVVLAIRAWELFSPQLSVTRNVSGILLILGRVKHRSFPEASVSYFYCSFDKRNASCYGQMTRPRFACKLMSNSVKCSLGLYRNQELN